jgi:SIR2-like protein
VWEGILRRLYDWAQTPEREESHAHRVLLQVLRPGQARPPNLAILTTNVDPLLESHGYRRANVGYIHGNPDDPEKWIFTVDNYWNAFNSDGVSRIFSRFQADGVLFLGYGHSHEDFDIAQTFVLLAERLFRS